MELPLIIKIGYYLAIAYSIYFINGGSWRKNVFKISEKAYIQLKELRYIFFPKIKYQWKEKWFKPARFVWRYNIYLTGISQVIGIYLTIKFLNQYNESYLTYLIPIIFTSTIPALIAVLGVAARYYILEEMIEFFERRAKDD